MSVVFVIGCVSRVHRAIEKNDYNHITATYYLLAERKLRANRQESSTARKPFAPSFIK